MNAAQGALNAAEATLAINAPKTAQPVAQAQTQLDQAASAMRATQDAQRANAVKAEGQLTAAQTQYNQALASAQVARDRATANAAANDLSLVGRQQAVHEAAGTVTGAEAAVDLAEANGTAAVQEAQAALEQAVGQLAQAEANYAQITAPASDADVAQAEAQVHSAASGVSLARSNLDGALLVAPIDATVAQVNAGVGQTIGLSGGAASPTPAVVLSDLSKMRVRAEVNESDIGGVRPGAQVDFTVSAYPSDTFGGRVRAIQPLGVSENNVVTYIVFVDIHSYRADQTLLPTMTANTTITTASRREVLTVPNAAVEFAQREGVRRAKRTAPTPDTASTGTPASVVVLEAGEPVLQRIRIGLSDGTTTEVLAGLSEGQSVITGGDL